MDGGHLQAMLFIMNRPEPIRQSALLMVLATGIGDASTLISGLKSLSAESNPPWGNKIAHLLSLLEQGQRLSEALTTVTELLPEHTLIAIRVGEETGTLRQVLSEEAHRLMKSTDGGSPVRPTLGSTLVWLLVVGMLLLSVVSYLMFFIIPKYKKIFADFGVDLPEATEKLITISDSFVGLWMIGPLPVVGVVVFLAFHFIYWRWKWLKTGRVLFAEHVPRFWTPLILRMLSLTAATRHTFGETIHSVLKELRPGKAATRLSSVRMRVSAGEDILDAMETEGFLRKREVAFLKSATRTQHVDWGLLHVSRTLERRRSRWSQMLPTVIQPVVVVVAGAVIGFVAIAMFLPLIKLVNDLG